jgi:hypothetical protein
MKQYEIKITGSGTANQLAIRLLELGRHLQIADVYDTFEQDVVNENLGDDVLTIEIKEE